MIREELISKILQNAEFEMFELNDEIYGWEEKKELREIILNLARVKVDYEMWKEKCQCSDNCKNCNDLSCYGWNGKKEEPKGDVKK